LTLHGLGNFVHLQVLGVCQDAQDEWARRVGSKEVLAVLEKLPTVLVVEVSFLQGSREYISRQMNEADKWDKRQTFTMMHMTPTRWSQGIHLLPRQEWLVDGSQRSHPGTHLPGTIRVREGGSSGGKTSHRCPRAGNKQGCRL